MNVPQIAPTGQARRVSSDSVWPLRRADGTRFCDSHPAIDRPVTLTDVSRAIQEHYAAYDAFHEAKARNAPPATMDDLAMRLAACRSAHKTMLVMAGVNETTAERVVQL